MATKYNTFKVVTDDEEYNNLPEFASDIEQPIDANDNHPMFPVSRTPVTHRNVVLHNYLVRSAQCLTLAEKRILMYGIAKIGGINQDIKISAMDYAEAYDLELNTAYEQLKDSANKLRSRFLSWQIKDGRKICVRNTQWLQGYDYYDKEGYVKFRFSSYVHEYLFDLYQEFTKYQLKQACALRSIHSWRLLELFEMMKCNKKNGWLKIDIEEFYHAMEAKESYKQNFSLLRQRIIEPAVKELMTKDNWEIEWRTIKRGRKVIMLEFAFERSPQGDLFKS